MMEEFYACILWIGDYKIVEQEYNTYDACLTHIKLWAEDKLEVEAYHYNRLAKEEKHLMYWNIEKRYRLAEIKDGV